MNTLKARLAAGEMAIATNPGGRNADAVALLARHGSHALFVDCERSGIGLDAAAELLFAARAARLPSIVRPRSADASDMVRFLDRGADGLVVPHCESAEDAQAAVDLLRFACGPLAQEKTLIIQIETKRAVQDLERIAAVPGVDAFLIGPNDLAWEVCGERGAKNATMTALLDDICARLKAQGRRYGMPAPMNELAQFRQRGCTLLYNALDWLVASGMQQLRKEIE